MCVHVEKGTKKEIEAFDPVEGVGTFVSVDEHAVDWIKTIIQTVIRLILFISIGAIISGLNISSIPAS